MTTLTPHRASPTRLRPLFAAWAWRLLDRLPAYFQDVEPSVHRLMRPF